MNFTGFSESDFNVFHINGLERRMEELKGTIRPKLEFLGQYFSPTLTSLTGDEMFFHVAKHARRTKNPPKDTWVAFASSKRGYKMLPHFQIGLWETHLFVWFAIIYESPIKEVYGKKLAQNFHELKPTIPNDFVWSIDHSKPEAMKHSSLSDNEFHHIFERLQFVKKAEILCGSIINRHDAVAMNADQLMEKIEDTFKQLIPLYQLAVNSSK